MDRLKAEIKALSEVITPKGEGEQIRIRREIEEARAGVKACTDIIDFSKSEIAGREREKQKLFLDIESAHGQIEGARREDGRGGEAQISLNSERGLPAGGAGGGAWQDLRHRHEV